MSKRLGHQHASTECSPKRAIFMAFVAPVIFSIAFFFVYSPVPSEGPDRFVAWPSVCVTALGVAALLVVIRAVYHAFRVAGLDFTTFLTALLTGVFAMELLLAAWLISQRPI
ncbi:hypothetical protein ACXR0O_25355 [Verrucomicrobiota bacterium sgz303538]